MTVICIAPINLLDLCREETAYYVVDKVSYQYTMDKQPEINGRDVGRKVEVNKNQGN